MLKQALKAPVYAQLASDLKHRIAAGEFPPGARIPSDTALSQTYGVAIMTVRNAIRLLSEDGLLRRIHGSGTYVCGPDWTKASFHLEGLLDKLADKDQLDIRILLADTVEASPRAARYLNIDPGEMILTLVRLVSHQERPLLLNKAYLVSDPRLPIVESELEASSLTGLFSGQGNSFIKKVFLKIEPCFLAPAEAANLHTTVTMPSFKIRYTFFNFQDRAIGSGWFLTPMDNLSLCSKIGVWDEDGEGTEDI